MKLRLRNVRYLYLFQQKCDLLLDLLQYRRENIAAGQDVAHTFVKFIIYPLTMIALAIFSVDRFQLLSHSLIQNENNFFAFCGRDLVGFLLVYTSNL